MTIKAYFRPNKRFLKHSPRLPKHCFVNYLVRPFLKIALKKQRWAPLQQSFLNKLKLFEYGLISNLENFHFRIQVTLELRQKFLYYTVLQTVLLATFFWTHILFNPNFQTQNLPLYPLPPTLNHFFSLTM